MFESIVAPIINRLLGEYVEGLETTNMSIGIWQGDVVLNKLKLHRESLDSLGLPISVSCGYIGELSLKIPWNDLKNKPVKVVIQDLHLIAAPRSRGVSPSRRRKHSRKGSSVSPTAESPSSLAEEFDRLNAADDDDDDVREKLSDYNSKQEKLKIIDPFLRRSEFYVRQTTPESETPRDSNALPADETAISPTDGSTPNQSKASYTIRPPTAVLAAAMTAASSLPSFEGSDEAQAGLVTQLTTKVMDNLQVTIKKIHIRYEQELDGRVFGVGFSLDELSAVSTDSEWNISPNFVEDNNKTIYKLVKLSNLSSYWDVDSEKVDVTSDFETFLFQSRSLVGRKENSSDSGVKDHQYLLQPVSGVAKIISKKKYPADKSARHSAAVSFDDLEFAMDDYQYVNLLAIIESFSSYVRSRRYRRFRPPSNITVRDDPRLWLQYAIKSVTYEIYEARKVWSWSYIRERIKDRKRYVALFVKKQYVDAAKPMPLKLAETLGFPTRDQISGSDNASQMDNYAGGLSDPALGSANAPEYLTASEKNELIELERKIPFDCIVLFRAIAYSHVIKNNNFQSLLSVEERRRQAAAQQRKGSQGWVSSISGWWYGGQANQSITSSDGSGQIDQAGADTNTAEMGIITEKDIEDLYNTIEYDPSKPNQNLDLPSDAVVLTLTCELKSGSLQLNNYSERKRSASGFASLAFTGLKGDITQYVKGRKGNFSMRDMLMKDLSNNASSRLYPVLVSAIQASESVGIKTLEGSETSNFLTMSLEQLADEPSNEYDGKFALSMLPLKVNYNPKVIKSVLKFFRPARISSITADSALYTIQSAVGDTIQGIKNSTMVNLENMISEHKRILVSIDIAAPIFVLPEDCTLSTCNILVVDAGHLKVENEVIPKSKAQELNKNIASTNVKAFQQLGHEGAHGRSELVVNNGDTSEGETIDPQTLEYVSQLAFDHYVCSLTRVQLFMSKSLEECMTVAKKSQDTAFDGEHTGHSDLVTKPKLHLVEPIDASIKIDVCTIPQYLSWKRDEAQIRLHGALERVQVNLSDAKYKSFMRILQNLTDSISVQVEEPHVKPDAVPKKKSRARRAGSSSPKSSPRSDIDTATADSPLLDSKGTVERETFSRSPSYTASFSSSFKDSMTLSKLHPMFLDGDEFYDATEAPIPSHSRSSSSKKKSNHISSVPGASGRITPIKDLEAADIRWTHDRLSFILDVAIKKASVTLSKHCHANDSSELENGESMLVSANKTGNSMPYLFQTAPNSNPSGTDVEVALAHLAVSGLTVDVKSYALNGLIVKTGIKSVTIEDLVAGGSDDSGQMDETNSREVRHFLTPSHEDGLGRSENSPDLIAVTYRQTPRFAESDQKQGLVIYTNSGDGSNDLTPSERMVVKSAVSPSSFEQTVKANFAAVSMTMTSDSIIVLYDFIIQTFTSSDAEQVENVDSATEHSQKDAIATPTASENYPGELTIAQESSLKCDIAFNSVTVIINDSKVKLATAYLGQLSSTVHLLSKADTGRTIKVEGRIGNFKVLNELVSPNIPHGSSAREFLGIEGDHVADFKWQSFDRKYAEYRGRKRDATPNGESAPMNYDSELWLRMSSVRIILMEDLLINLAKFSGKLSQMRVLLETAREKAESTAQQIQETAGRFHYDIRIDTPLVIYPCKPTLELDVQRNYRASVSPRELAKYSDEIVFYPGSVTAINEFIVRGDAGSASTPTSAFIPRKPSPLRHEQKPSLQKTKKSVTIVEQMDAMQVNTTMDAPETIVDAFEVKSDISLSDSRIALRYGYPSISEVDDGKSNAPYQHYQIIDGIDVTLESTSTYRTTSNLKSSSSDLAQNIRYTTKVADAKTTTNIKFSPIKLFATSLTQQYLFQCLNTISQLSSVGPNSKDIKADEHMDDMVDHMEMELDDNVKQLTTKMSEMFYLFQKDEGESETFIELPKAVLELSTIDIDALRRSVIDADSLNVEDATEVSNFYERKRKIYAGSPFGFYDLQHIILKTTSKSLCLSKVEYEQYSDPITLVNWSDMVATFSIKNFIVNDTRQNKDLKFRDIWKKKSDGSLLRLNYKKALDHGPPEDWIGYLVDESQNGLRKASSSSISVSGETSHSLSKPSPPREHLSMVFSGASVIVVPDYILEMLKFFVPVKDEEDDNKDVTGKQSLQDNEMFTIESDSSVRSDSCMSGAPKLPNREPEDRPPRMPDRPSIEGDSVDGRRSQDFVQSFKRQQRLSRLNQRDRSGSGVSSSSPTRESGFNANLLDGESSSAVITKTSPSADTEGDLDAPKRLLTFSVDLGNIEFIVLQDPSSLRSNAVSFSVPQLALSHLDDTTTITLQGVQSSIYEMSNAIEVRSNFVDPFNAALVYKSRTIFDGGSYGKKVNFTDINIDISEISGRTSYRDFVLIQDVFRQLTAGNSNDIQVTVLDEPPANTDLYSPSTEAPSPNPVVLKPVQEKRPRERLSAVLHGMRMVLIDDLDSFHLPIFDLILQETIVKVSDWSSSLDFRVTPSLSVNFFNIKNSHWEPLAEPWSFTFSINKQTDNLLAASQSDSNAPSMRRQSSSNSIGNTMNATAIEFLSKQKIELTITQTLIETILRTVHNWSTSSNAVDVYERREVHHPYLIRNRTGCNFFMWSSNIEGDGLNTELCHVENGKDVPWKIDNGISEKGFTGSKVSIQFESIPWEVLKSIPLHMEGCYTYGLRPARENNITDGLVCEVKLEGSIKVVTLRSALILRNKTGVELEFLLVTKQNQAHEVPTKVAPGAEFYVPITSVCDDVILLRPNLGNHNYKWSNERLAWKSVKDVQSSLIKCESKINNNLAFRFQLTASANYDFAKISYPLMEWVFYPPFQIENLLPYDFSYIVFDKTERNEQRGTLKKGKVESLYTVNPTHMLALGIELPDAKFIVNTVVLISDTEMEYRDKLIPMVHTQSSRVKLNLRLKYNDNLRHGCKKVQIYSSYAILNKSGLDIAVAPKLILSSSNDFIIPASRNEEGKVEPQMFSIDSIEPMQSKVTLRTRFSVESSPINFDVVGSTFGVVLPPAKAGNPVTKLGVSVIEGEGKYFMTKVVVVAPRFIVKNNLDVKMHVKQFRSEKTYAIMPNGKEPLVEFGTGNIMQGLSSPVSSQFNDFLQESVILAGNSLDGSRSDAYGPQYQRQAVLYALFSSMDLSDYLCLRFSNANGMWSNPFCINEIGTIYVKTERSDASSVDLVKVEIVIKDATVFIVLSKVETMWPILIRNTSGITLSVRQYGSQSKLAIASSQGSSFPFAWDYPSAPRKVLMMSVADEERSIDLLEIGQQIPFSYYDPVTQRDGVVAINVTVEGLTTILTLSKYSEKRSAFLKNVKDGQSTNRRLQSVDTEANFEDESNRQNTKWLRAKAKNHNVELSLNVKLEGLGISFVDKHMKELFYAACKDFSIILIDTNYTTTTSASIKWLQIDNMFSSSIEPILVYPSVIPKDKDSDYNPVLMVALSKVKDSSYGVVYFDFFTLLLQELSVEVDEAFLIALMQAVNLDLPWLKVSPPEEICDLNYDIKEPSLIQGSERLYFEHFLLQPMQVNVSFVRTDADDDYTEVRSEQRSGGISSLVFDVLTMTLGNVHDAPLRLNALELKHPNVTLESLKELMYKFYSQEIMNQFGHIVGAADFLGNPVGLFNNVASGVSDFFYEPMQGFQITRPQDFGLGVAKGTASLVRKTVFGVSDTFTKITGSLGKGLSMITFDNEYKKIRRQSARNRPKHATAGVANGASFLAKSVASGITGVISKPMEGAAQEGVGGFFKGLGKGVIGMVAKPVIGVIDLANNVGEGIRSTATEYDNSLDRQRLPRYIGPDAVIRPYDDKLASGLHIMLQIDDGAFADEIFCAVLDLRRDTLMLIATYRSVMCVRRSRMRSEWVVPFEILGTIRLNPISGELALYGKPGTLTNSLGVHSELSIGRPALPMREPSNSDIFSEERRMFGASRPIRYEGGLDSGSESDANNGRVLNHPSTIGDSQQETEVLATRAGGGRFYTTSVTDNIGARLGLSLLDSSSVSPYDDRTNFAPGNLVMASGGPNIGMGDRRLMFVMACPDIHEAHEFALRLDAVFTAFVDERKPYD